MSAPCRVLIVDDEALSRRRLRRLLEGRDEIAIAGECRNGAEAVAEIQRSAPDLVLLDVQMPDLDGFGVIERLAGQRLPEIIFVTAHDQYALDAFDVAAVDYLLKPFDDERFERALERALSRLREGAASGLPAQLAELLDRARGGGARRLAVPDAGRIAFVDLEDLEWLEAEDNYVRLHLGDRSLLMRETLKELERRLGPAGFARVHRSALVNLARVQELIPESHGECWLVLRNGARIRVSRTFSEAVRARLGAG